MFTLLSGLWKYLFQKDEYCILILGLDNAGKSVSEAVSFNPLQETIKCDLKASIVLALIQQYLKIKRKFFIFQTLLEQIKRIYGNNYSGLAFEKIKTTIGLNSKFDNTHGC